MNHIIRALKSLYVSCVYNSTTCCACGVGCSIKRRAAQVVGLWGCGTRTAGKRTAHAPPPVWTADFSRRALLHTLLLSRLSNFYFINHTLTTVYGTCCAPWHNTTPHLPKPRQHWTRAHKTTISPHPDIFLWDKITTCPGKFFVP